MRIWRKEDMRYDVNHKRIEQLYKVMGIQTIFSKRNLGKRNQKHKIYPYLLKNLMIVCPNKEWQANISYKPLERGFICEQSFVYSRKHSTVVSLTR